MREEEIDAFRRVATRSLQWSTNMVQRFRKSERSVFNVKIAVVLAGTLLASIAQFLPEEPAQWDMAKLYLGVGGAILAFLGGIAVAFTELGSSQILTDARAALDEASTFLLERNDLQEQVDELLEAHRKRASLYAAAGVMRNTIEQAAAQRKNKIKPIVSDLVQSAARPLCGAMGFEGGEGWAISVLMVEDDLTSGAQGLVRIEELHADRVDEGRKSRTWLTYEGFAGLAFTKRKEVVIPELTEELYALLNIPETKRQEDDVRRYRSVAAVPIIVGSDPNSEASDAPPAPWGVVVGSSDWADRFDYDLNQPGAENVEAIRCLANMIALAVAVTRPVNSETIR